MAFFERDQIKIYYEEHGDGFPVLLFAPGGPRSAINFWEDGPFNPITELAPYFRVIAMDQRNAGQSTAPVSGDDGWHSYTADHLALLDHLGIERTHVMGACIGGPYCLGLMQTAPDRVTAGVLQQTIGLDNNREIFYKMFQAWADDIEGVHPEANDAAWQSFKSNMFDGDLDFNVGSEFVKSCSVPMLILMGDDAYHPQITSRTIAEIAPNAMLIEQWKAPEDDTVNKIVNFLTTNTPSA